MRDSSIAHRLLRRWRITAFVAVAVVSAAIAAVPGLPFTESFEDQDLRDAAATDADWGIGAFGVLQLGSEVSLENVSISGAEMGDGNDGPHNSRGIALGDFDGDGDLDAAVANRAGEVNLTYENIAGAFTAAPDDLGTDAENSQGIDVGDIDLDGDLDIVVSNKQSTNVFHLNDGSGTFSAKQNIDLQAGRFWPIKLVDVDGDGDLDIVVGQDENRVNKLYRNTIADDSNLVFNAEDIGTETLSTRSLTLGDINSDGFVDLVTGDYAAENHLYLGNADGGFDASSTIQPGQAWNTFSVALADLNGDGALDLVEGSQRNDDTRLNGETRIYLNNLAGGFQAPSLLPGSKSLHTTVALLLIDFDRDGDIDIIEGNNGDWDHDGDDPAPPGSPTIPADNTRCTGATACVAQPKRLYLNDGLGTFTFASELVIAGANEETYAMAAGDLDNDGIVDFVTSNEAGENVAYSLTGTDSLNPAVVQLRSVAESIRVDDGTDGNVRFARISAGQNVPDLADMKFFLSNDGGSVFVPAPLDRPVEFATSNPSGGVNMRWRVELSTASSMQVLRPTLNQLTISAGNLFPQFNGPAAFTGIQGDPLVPVQLDVSDGDGDRLTYFLSGLPAGTGLSVDVNTGIISGTVSAADAAAAPIVLAPIAFDGVRFNDINNDTITFTIGGPNEAPVVDVPIGPQMATVGTPVNLDVSGNFSDPDLDALRFTATGLPATLTMSLAGVLTGTPETADIGAHSVTVTALDGGGAFVSDMFVLTVEAANQAPVVDTMIGDQTATEGTAINVDVSGNFSDPDGDALTFSYTGLPASITGSAAGVISGTPVAADVGTLSITVTATDPSGAFVSGAFTVTVSAAPPPPPPPPRSSGGGCTIGPSDGMIDPTLPLLMLTSLVYLVRRRISPVIHLPKGDDAKI